MMYGSMNVKFIAISFTTATSVLSFSGCKSNKPGSKRLNKYIKFWMETPNSPINHKCFLNKRLEKYLDLGSVKANLSGCDIARK
jgi:hypothetical protein